MEESNTNVNQTSLRFEKMADSRGKDIEGISFCLTDIVMGILYFFLMLHRKEDLSIIKMYCFITQNELN